MARPVNAHWEALRARLRRRRLDLGLSHVDLGRVLGKVRDYSSYLENSTRSYPNVVTVIEWAAALGGRIEIVFPGDEKHESQQGKETLVEVAEVRKSHGVSDGEQVQRRYSSGDGLRLF